MFGALTSTALHPSEHFYGTGESLLFSFQPVEDTRRASQPADTDKEDNKDDKDGKEEDII